MNQILQGDALTKLKELADESIDCVMTSPPYWALRDYGVEGQIGLDKTIENYIKNLCAIFYEVKRVLKKSGTCWVNLGDTYMGNSSYSKDGRQGYEEKTGMINKKTWLDPKYPHKEKLRAREHIREEAVPNKSLCLIPFHFALEMVSRGWILRNDIIWHKPNAMPSSVKDRFTVDYEHLFFFVKSKKYYFETQYEKAISGNSASFNLKVRDAKRGYQKSGQYLASEKENEQYHGQQIKYGSQRTMRSVWKIATKPFPEAHFATYPEALCEIPIKAGCPEGGIVLDPFFGAGTTGLVALKQGKRFIGIELNKEYIDIAMDRLAPFMEEYKEYKKDLNSSNTII